MQDEFEQFIGKNYASVSDEIIRLAKVRNLDVLPWPNNIGLVSEDPNTLIVYINNDIDDIILAIKIV